MTTKELLRTQKQLDKLYKLLGEETSSHGLEIVAEIVEMELLLEAESNK